MPHRTRLTETIAQALRELEVDDRYAVNVFPGKSPDDWRAEIKPVTTGTQPFYLRFSISHSPDWVAMVDVAKQQIQGEISSKGLTTKPGVRRIVMDKTTKILLFAIATGLWLNLATEWIGPSAVQAQSTWQTVMLDRVTNLDHSVRSLATGVCNNKKIC